MKKILLLCLIGFSAYHSFAQLKAPYTETFETTAPGWKHYATLGKDDWAIGAPNTGVIYGNGSIKTNLIGFYSPNSKMFLETPVFNLSDTTGFLCLSFYHKFDFTDNTFASIEFSKDGGLTWVLLNQTSSSKMRAWYNYNGNTTFAQTAYSNYRVSNPAINIKFLQGNKDVRFRFALTTSNYASPGQGWTIDEFSIAPESFNLFTSIGVPRTGYSKYIPTFSVRVDIRLINQYENYCETYSNFYFSRDSIFDTKDSLMGSSPRVLLFDSYAYDQTLNLPGNLWKGTYYIFHKLKFASIFERDTSDNIGYTSISLDSTYTLPYVEDFESSSQAWKTSDFNSKVWKLGFGSRHHLEGAHSGKNAWGTVGSTDSRSNISYDLSSPWLHLPDSSVIAFWYKTSGTNAVLNVQNTNTSSSFPYASPIGKDDDWTPFVKGMSAIRAMKLHFSFTEYGGAGTLFDDIYIGISKPDLSLEKNKTDRYMTDAVTDTLQYTLFNSGSTTIKTPFQTDFYWSLDTILDAGDVLIGTDLESGFSTLGGMSKKLSFKKPNTASGIYYILYKIDSKNTIDEMRKYNNTGFYKIDLQASQKGPYFNDFESSISGWRHCSIIGLDEWKWTSPKKKILNKAFSGTKGWISNDTGMVSDMSYMQLYSPIFELGTINNPVLEFDMKLNSDELCSCFEAKTNMHYSIDGGENWNVLDTLNQSFKCWYSFMEYGGMDYLSNYSYYSENTMNSSEKVFIPYNEYQGRDNERNTHFVLDITGLKKSKYIQFRYNLSTGKNSLGASGGGKKEGAFIDNFSLKEKYIDLNVRHKKTLIISELTKNIHFEMNVKNSGNYISAPCSTSYYLSGDTIIDANDTLIGRLGVPAIRPDLSYYLNAQFKAPIQLKQYNYLLSFIDDKVVNIESNKKNNLVVWPIIKDSLFNLPYISNFKDTIIPGWTGYSDNAPAFRFRNQLAPGEHIYQTTLLSGQMFTDRVPYFSGSASGPLWVLETPSFNFSKTGTINISFDLFCMGENSLNNSGGNFSYTIDGGSTWVVLSAMNNLVSNWYNASALTTLNNEEGWASPYASFTNCTYQADFLAGKKVQFRYKYKSTYEPLGGGTNQGMRIDNFKISGTKIITHINESNTSKINSYINDQTVFASTNEAAEGSYLLTIYNMTGSKIHEQQTILHKEMSAIKLPSLSAGMYLIRIQDSGYRNGFSILKYYLP
jgi:hypothetical protein